MCRQCYQIEQEKKLRQDEERKLTLRIGKVHHNLLQLLSTDKIKGSEYIRLKEISISRDLENLTVVEQIIVTKSK